jgi:hypothetical protein
VSGVVRLVIWNLGDSMTTLAELREQLPWLEPPDTWISNEASERFGLVAFGEPPRDAVEHVQALIGSEPVVGEEFDVE